LGGEVYLKRGDVRRVSLDRHLKLGVFREDLEIEKSASDVACTSPTTLFFHFIRSRAEPAQCHTTLLHTRTEQTMYKSGFESVAVSNLLIVSNF